jgi:hypothetical protein
MKFESKNEPAERIKQPVFVLHGIAYLPSYDKPHRWIGPGPRQTRSTYTTLELLEAQAELKSHPLWPRFWIDEQAIAIINGQAVAEGVN